MDSSRFGAMPCGWSSFELSKVVHLLCRDQTDCLEQQKRVGQTHVDKSYLAVRSE